MSDLVADLPHLYEEDHLDQLSMADKWMGERMVILPSGRYLLRHRSGVWSEYSNDRATRLAAFNEWGMRPPHRLTQGDIERFMKMSAPSAAGMILWPRGKQIGAEFRGLKFVNSWRPEALIEPVNPDLEVRGTVERLFRMIRNSLCGKTGTLSLDDMIRAGQSDDPAELEFRFLMSWLADMVQSPGSYRQTVIWLVGEMGGVGKGTLVEILTTILSRRYVALIQADELKRGWTDSIGNHLLCVVNEIERSPAKWDWNLFIKQHACEPELTLAKRQTGSVEVPNTVSWLFCSNDERPAALDAFDRRNMLIATTTDPAMKEEVGAFRAWMERNPEDALRMVQGFAYFLKHWKVDRELLRGAPDTPLRLEIQASTQKDADLYYWLEVDDSYPRDQALPAKVYAQAYADFSSCVRPIKPAEMGRLLSNLARKQRGVEAHGTKKYGRYRILSSVYPAVAVDERRQAELRERVIRRSSGNVVPLLGAQ